MESTFKIESWSPLFLNRIKYNLMVSILFFCSTLFLNIRKSQDYVLQHNQQVQQLLLQITRHYVLQYN